MSHRSNAILEQSFYPFESEQHWLSHVPLVDAEVLPAYDPAVHARPIRPNPNRLLHWLRLIPATILFMFVFAPAFSVLCGFGHHRARD